MVPDQNAFNRPSPGADPALPQQATRQRRLGDPLRRSQRSLRVCESRLALSASLAADLVLSSIEDPTPAADGDPAAIPSDWLLEQAAEIRQQYGLDGAGQSIAVIDSGIAWDHVALGGGFGPGYRVVGGWDFAENDADPYDDAPAGFHGSHVSGLLAGDGPGFSGIAPGADLLALRVFDDSGRGSLDAIESALEWVHENRDAYEHPITTVNLSLGAILHEANEAQVLGQLEDELQQLHDDGIIVVAAAGNQFDADFPSRVTYPAESRWVTAVGSIDADGALSGFSQRQADLLTAPGHQVRSSVPDHVFGWDGNVDDYAATDGTSMAAPQVAAASALVRQAMLQADPAADTDPAAILGHLRETAITATDPLTGLTYHTVDLEAAIDALLADSQQDTTPPLESSTLDPAQAVDLGMIDSQTVTLNPDQWYTLRGTHDGILSLSIPAGTLVEAVDGQGRPLESFDRFTGADSSADATQQLDYQVGSQQAIFLRLQNAGPETVAITNLLQFDGGDIRVLGTGQSDQVRLDLTDVVTLQVNGAQYRFDSTTGLSSLRIQGDGGSDRIDLQGSTATERLVLHPGGNASGEASRLLRQGLTVQFDGFEQVSFDGGGGADQASVYDTPGDDQLTTRPGEAHLTGAGYSFRVTDVPRIYVHATAGGEDTAFVYDSSADETLVIRPQFTSLRGETHFNLAYGFERVYAFAQNGGQDEAKLYDSEGDDRMSASAVSASISGPGYYASARYFESVEANATFGGHDTARLYAADDSVRWQHAGGLIQMIGVNADGETLERTARGFDDVGAFVAGAAADVQLQSFAPAPSSFADPSPTLSPALSRPASLSRPALLWDVSGQHDTDAERRAEALLDTATDPRSARRALAALFERLGEQD
ncbi:S8 family peptidase [Roseimaritima sediminicola]|uniref:S8 family peptidase n=1 Tax=Roseimaritima sediminicola TaxID=2662066 RepID=UPI001298356D|nr:S8 family serine peptidase [Roseimaritima sediminicola]